MTQKLKTRLTQKEIARLAGVSQVTVYAVLNNRADLKISTKTQKKVREIIKQHNYQPNILGRNLKRGKTGMLGVVVPTYHSYSNSSFYVQILLGMHEAAITHKRFVTLFSTEVDYLNIIRQQMVDGILVLESQDLIDIPGIREVGVPMAVINRKTPDTGYLNIISDNAGSTRRATAAFLNAGFRSVIFLSNNLDHDSIVERFHGYRAALDSHDCAYNPEHVVLIDPVLPSTGQHHEFRKRLKTVLKQAPLPLAVVSTSLPLAEAAYREVQRAGLKIPEQAAFVINDLSPIQINHSNRYGFSYFEQNTRELGNQAVNALIQNMERKNPDARRIVIPIDFHQMKTTGLSSRHLAAINDKES